MRLTAMFRWIVFPGVLIGFMLHVFTCFFMAQGGPSGFTVGLFALSTLPYSVCLVVGMRNARGALMAACSIALMLLLDVFAFNEAFISPTTSTSSLVLLVVPVINLGVMVLGFVVGWIAFPMFRRNTAGEPK